MTATWNKLSPAHAPSARYSAQTCLDPNTGNILLFGGFDDALGDHRWDTWKWDGSDWTEIFPATIPEPGIGNVLYQNDLGWDGVNERLVLVAKESSGVGYRFWYWDWVTPDWVEFVPPTVPTGGFLFGAKLTWSPVLGSLVMFVDSGGTAWTYDGSDFTDTGECVPEPGYGVCQNVDGATFTFDAVQGVIVQYGGSTSSVIHWTGTSTFDGSYTQQTPNNNPGYRADHARWAAWSNAFQATIVYGGDDNSDDARTFGYLDIGGGTYDWVNLAPVIHPGAVRDMSLCTDRNGNVLAFGGNGPVATGSTNYDETWLLTMFTQSGTLYGARGRDLTTSDLYTINHLTGVCTSIGPIGYAISDMAFDHRAGIMWAVTSGASAVHPFSLIRIDLRTGHGIFVAELDGSSINPGWPGSAEDIGIEILPDGTLVGLTYSAIFEITNWTLFEINMSNGEVTGINSSNDFSDMAAMVYSTDLQWLYIYSGSDNVIRTNYKNADTPDKSHLNTDYDVRSATLDSSGLIWNLEVADNPISNPAMNHVLGIMPYPDYDLDPDPNIGDHPPDVGGMNPTGFTDGADTIGISLLSVKKMDAIEWAYISAPAQYQRIYGWHTEISEDSLESVSVLVSPQGFS